MGAERALFLVVGTLLLIKIVLIAAIGTSLVRDWLNRRL